MGVVPLPGLLPSKLPAWLSGCVPSLDRVRVREKLECDHSRWSARPILQLRTLRLREVVCFPRHAAQRRKNWVSAPPEAFRAQARNLEAAAAPLPPAGGRWERSPSGLRAPPAHGHRETQIAAATTFPNTLPARTRRAGAVPHGLPRAPGCGPRGALGRSKVLLVRPTSAPFTPAPLRLVPRPLSLSWGPWPARPRPRHLTGDWAPQRTASMGPGLPPRGLWVRLPQGDPGLERAPAWSPRPPPSFRIDLKLPPIPKSSWAVRFRGSRLSCGGVSLGARLWRLRDLSFRGFLWGDRARACVPSGGGDSCWGSP